jgi:actin-related protein
LYFIKNSVSSAFSEAKSNAIVIDSGHNFTTVSRIIDGYNEKTITFNFAGNIISYELENYLKSKSLLDKTNFCISSKTRCDVFDQLCKFKEITSFKQSFKIDSNSEVEEEGEITLELPDKATIKFGRNEIIEPFTQYQDYKKISDLSFPENYYSIARSAVDLLEEDNHSNYVNSIVITGKIVTI